MNHFMSFFPDALHFTEVDSANLILLLGAILLLGSLGGRLFQKLKIPQVVGYIVIGIIIGQSGLRILSKNVITSLTPLSSLALSLIGFLIGGELKLKTIKKYGKQFVGILLFESITPFIINTIIITIIGTLITHNFASSIALGLVLGAISSATAPAATTDVLSENRTRGPLTTTVLGIVALDDAVGLILYAIASSVAEIFLGVHGQGIVIKLLLVLYDVFGSIVLGAFIGWLLTLMIQNAMSNPGRILAFSLGMLLLSCGIASLLKLDNILTAMSLGFFMVNFAPAKTRPTFTLVENFTPPVYVLFFVLVGAKLNIWQVTPFVGIIALIYVTSRTFGKSLGAVIGSIITKAPETVKKYLPYCLLSQAGVAIGLSISAGTHFANTIGPTVLLIVTATTFIVQILGPICVKYGITKAGECNLAVNENDIMKNTHVSDITSHGNTICCLGSHTIVNEFTPLDDLIEAFSHHQNLNYEVKDTDGKLSGIVTLENIKESLSVGGDLASCLLAMDIMEKPPITCHPDTTIPELYELYQQYDCEAIAIVDEEGKAMGMLGKHIVDHYLHAKVVELQKKVTSLG
ncbi:MAG: sodium:proton exchanger [Treponema sp. CETP13]|nr:MAG: sodium:proton exchanger [Treponema sp. CETP13]